MDVSGYEAGSLPAVTSLPTKAQGRPLLLGKMLDDTVQNVISNLRRNKAIINSRIVMAVAEGVLKFEIYQSSV